MVFVTINYCVAGIYFLASVFSGDKRATNTYFVIALLFLVLGNIGFVGEEINLLHNKVNILHDKVDLLHDKINLVYSVSTNHVTLEGK